MVLIAITISLVKSVISLNPGGGAEQILESTHLGSSVAAYTEEPTEKRGKQNAINIKKINQFFLFLFIRIDKFRIKY